MVVCMLRVARYFSHFKIIRFWDVTIIVCKSTSLGAEPWAIWSSSPDSPSIDPRIVVFFPQIDYDLYLRIGSKRGISLWLDYEEICLSYTQMVALDMREELLYLSCTRSSFPLASVIGGVVPRFPTGFPFGHWPGPRGVHVLEIPILTKNTWGRDSEQPPVTWIKIAYPDAEFLNKGSKYMKWEFKVPLL